MIDDRPIEYKDFKKDLNQIRTGLRQAFIRSKYKAQFLSAKRIEIPKYKKNGELAKRPLIKYECNHCKGEFSQAMINVDHIEPVGTLYSLNDVPRFFDRLFCTYDNLQVLCKDCHDVKTKKDRKEMSEKRKILKEIL